MSEKIVVPEGMSGALYAKFCTGTFAFAEHELYEILKAAMIWLSENPIVPTMQDVKHITRVDKISLEDFISLQAFSTEWQRVMFKAPEVREAAKSIIQSMSGCRFTPVEADAILEKLMCNSCGWDYRAQKSKP